MFMGPSFRGHGMCIVVAMFCPIGGYACIDVRLQGMPLDFGAFDAVGTADMDTLFKDLPHVTIRCATPMVLRLQSWHM